MRLLFSVLLFSSTTVLIAQTPTVTPGGVVNAATFTAPVSPGSLVSIFGTNLARQPLAATVIPLPFSLLGVSVKFNGITVPLVFVSPTQINAQLPWEISPSIPVSVVVTNSAGSSAPQTVQVGPVSPGIFASLGYGIVFHQTGGLAAPTSAFTGLAAYPAIAGETLSILGTGLGPTNPPGITGNNSLDAFRVATVKPIVTVGGVMADVPFAGLSPQFVGVDQINFTIPPNLPESDNVTVQVQTGGLTASAVIAIGPDWNQWGMNAQHASKVAVPGQPLNNILADVIYDSLTGQEQASTGGELIVHYQVPLVNGNDVYMEFKSGTYDSTNFATQTWGENKYSWQNGQLMKVWSYASDWKAPGSLNNFFEPVFHGALANNAVYLPGASGSILKVSRADGTLLQRIAPFGTDANTYETGPISVDGNGNLFYNAIQVVVNSAHNFFANDATDSWLVKVTPDGAFSMVSYKALTSPEAPAGTAACLTTFSTSQVPWPPSPTAVPASSACGTQRVGLNIAPAIAPDGTIYSVTVAHFNSHYAYLVAIKLDLTKKWVASLRDRFNDGCGVAVADGGVFPPNGSPGGCRAGANLGVNPETNRPGDGTVIDSSSSSPTVAPDGTILYGAYTRYNYAQGHLMHFDANGNYLNAFGFGWDYTPATYSHDGTWSAISKNNHYGGLGSYCSDATACPPDRTATNPVSPEEYFVSQVSSNLALEWSFKSNNTQSCSRNQNGSLTCVSDHPFGFEWCVNAPVIDANGVVYANSEDGNLYSIGPGGVLQQKLFQQLAIGAAYTPASLGNDGKIYTQNDGHLFVVGK